MMGVPVWSRLQSYGLLRHRLERVVPYLGKLIGSDYVSGRLYKIDKNLYTDVDDPIVSCDVVKSDFSSTFDSLATMVLGERLSKTLSWYDAGWGYAQRVVDLVTRFAGLEAGR